MPLVKHDHLDDHKPFTTALCGNHMAFNLWDTVCPFSPYLRVLVACLSTLLILQAMSYPFIEPGSGTYQIFLTNFAIVLPALVIALSFLWKCKRKVQLPDTGS